MTERTDAFISYDRDNERRCADASVIVASNIEWLFRNGPLAGDEDWTEDERRDIVNDWIDEVIMKITDDDDLSWITATPATGRLATFHGWNGRVTDSCGLIIENDLDSDVITDLSCICENAAENVICRYLKE